LAGEARSEDPPVLTALSLTASTIEIQDASDLGDAITRLERRFTT
jgi:hypothetical protein